MTKRDEMIVEAAFVVGDCPKDVLVKCILNGGYTSGSKVGKAFRRAKAAIQALADAGWLSDEAKEVWYG